MWEEKNLDDTARLIAIFLLASPFLYVFIDVYTYIYICSI